MFKIVGMEIVVPLMTIAAKAVEFVQVRYYGLRKTT
jgi:hypothetical protein